VSRRPRRFLLALAAVAVTLLLGEVGARIALPLLPDPPGTAYVGDDSCGYLLRPTSPGEYPEDHPHHVNIMGFRDRNHAIKPTGGIRRVLGLGDSFVYGSVPMPQNFLRAAEDQLSRMGRPTEMILAGVPGWHTGNQAGWLESTGLGLWPSLVVVNFFVGNDVTGLSIGGRVIRGNLHPTTSPRTMRHLLRKSVLFLMFESQVLRPIRAGAGRPSAEDPAAPDATPVNDTYLYVMSQTLPVFLKEPDDRTAALWTEAEGYLEDIDALCRNAKVPWILVLIPDEIQVDHRVRRQVMAGLNLDPEAFDFTAPQNRLKALVEDRGIRVLDLMPVLSEAHRLEGRQYAPNDTHWNERGNATAGRALAEAIDAVIR